MSLRNRRKRLQTIATRLLPEIKASGETLPADAQEMEITASFEYVPGDLEAEKKEDKLPKIKLAANSGEPMELNGFADPVIINLKGAKFASRSTPIIASHDPERRIGHATKQTVDEKGINAEGVVSSVSKDAEEFKAEAANGYPYQVSVGARILDGYFVAEDQTATVNGKKYQGPLIVAKKTLIREFSVLTLGADPKTSARIAAGLFLNEENAMEFFAWLKATYSLTKESFEAMDAEAQKKFKDLHAKAKDPEPKPETKPPEDLTAGVKKDEPEDIEARTAEKIASVEKKADEVKAICASYPEVEKVTFDGKEMTAADFKAHAISKRLDPRDVKLAFLEAETPKASQFAIHSRGGTDYATLEAQVLEAAIVRQFISAKGKSKSGTEYGYETLYKEEVLEASEKFAGLGLHQLCDMGIQAAGYFYNGNRRDREYAKHVFASVRKFQERSLAASPGAGPFSTLGISNILENVGNKLLLSMFDAQEMKWDQIARIRPVKDFKTHSFYRLSVHGKYEKVGAHGQLKHGEFSDEKQTLSIETYGMIVGISRQDLINDDLSAFADTAMGIGRRAGLALECTVWKAFLALTPGISITNVLGVAGLTEAVEQFMDQVDSAGAPILVNPDRLIVGSPLKVTADQLYADLVTQDNAGFEFQNNPHKGSYRPVASPMVNNTSIVNPTDGDALGNQSDTQWFLHANPDVLAALNVGFLNGNRSPVLEQGDVSFDTLGLQWRSYHDFGTGDGDPEALLKSTGTGGSG